MNEQQTIDIINKAAGTNLVLSNNQMNDYDAEDNNYICEIKNRRKYYKQKVIEAVKLFKNFRHSNIKGKLFIYVVTDEKGIWVYNINETIEDIILHKPVIMSMPRTTDFNNTSKIIKYCYTLKEYTAIKCEFKNN